MPVKDEMLLSIITVNRNNEDGLRNTIQSVLSQTDILNQIEFLIIDGNSTDQSVEVIKEEFASMPVPFHTFWISEPDSGIYNAMNKGVRLAKGKYCLFLNSGDCLYSNTTLKNILNVLFSSNFDIISGNEQYDNGQIVKPIKDKDMNVFEYLTWFPLHQSTFIKSKLLQDLPYHEECKSASDYIFFFEALFIKKATYKSIDETISIYNLDGLSTVRPEIGKVEIENFINKTMPPFLMDYYKNTYLPTRAQSYLKYGKAVVNTPLLKLIYKILLRLNIVKED